MKLIIKLVISLLVILAVAYYGSVFVMPSITIVNNSGRITEQMEVTLPSSNLNFGALMNGEHNTLHYTLDQKDGDYRYKFKHENSTVYFGICGDVTNNEIHKRVVITVNENNQVICKTE
jgi:hypothetical protein